MHPKHANPSSFLLGNKLDLEEKLYNIEIRSTIRS